MNKIILESNINYIDSGEYLLESKENHKIVIQNSTILHNFEINNNNLSLHLKNESKLVINNFYIATDNINIDITLDSNSYLEYNLLIINEGNNKVCINIYLKGNENKCYINIKCINKNRDGILDVIINGIVSNNTQNNEFVENIKGFILNNDYIKISPNIDVLTNNAQANHLVTIGSFNKDELFYLTTKGIKIDKAKEIIIKGFLTSILSEPLKEFLNEEVIKFE